MKANTKWKDTLAAKLLVKVFQYYIFITVIVTLAHMSMDFSFTKDIVEDDLKVFHTSFEPGLSVALWNQEDDALQSSLLAIYHVPQIEGAKIIDENGNFVTAIGYVKNEHGQVTYYDPNTLSHNESISGDSQSLFSYSNNIHHQEDNIKYLIGNLILYSSDNIVFSQVQYGYIFIVINSIIKTLALWLIVLWQSKPLIYDPLNQISNRLKSERPDTLSDLHFDISKKENGELLLLKNALNKIFKMLALSIKERDIALNKATQRNEELSQFSYRTSHDLKAPLVTVRRLSHIIIEDVNSGDYEEVELNANRIATHVSRLENLVTDILDLARADLEITEHETVVLSQVLTDVKETLSGVYIEDDVQIIDDIDPELRVYVPRARINQILENLLSNALKYKDPCKLKCYVKVSAQNTGDEVLVVIEDNGVGIPLKYQTQVFQMFQRFHPEVSFGSGLGMYIVKKHIDNLSANINFTSSEKGTRFELTFKN
ncbi:HAMP domain-containing sensor histidine kinase [Pseudoalteromonas sp. MMG005]|uniref:sensor histidine kinase n=1 Tax=Pseudoalteromonas sp. MMG005 TaxID=2822682 RepID=UPI001B39DBFD|nr:HAMP domain-containing sensor histidine kinase [Pseudoalteromonas sp. MMG005]MBQ4847648.1 HAMP domain-containing histidine kinase [Pseudoalteromonas sp. MMG005]